MACGADKLPLVSHGAAATQCPRRRQGSIAGRAVPRLLLKEHRPLDAMPTLRERRGSSKAIAGFRWALSTLGCAVPSAVDALIGASGHWCPWGLWMLEDACGASGLLVGRLL
jgi:hypothetical protein